MSKRTSSKGKQQSTQELEIQRKDEEIRKEVEDLSLEQEPSREFTKLLGELRRNGVKFSESIDIVYQRGFDEGLTINTIEMLITEALRPVMTRQGVRYWINKKREEYFPKEQGQEQNQEQENGSQNDDNNNTEESSSRKNRGKIVKGEVNAEDQAFKSLEDIHKTIDNNSNALPDDHIIRDVDAENEQIYLLRKDYEELKRKYDEISAPFTRIVSFEDVKVIVSIDPITKEIKLERFNK